MAESVYEPAMRLQAMLPVGRSAAGNHPISAPFTVDFIQQGDARFTVSWTSRYPDRAHLNGHLADIETVSFYPLTGLLETQYVMSLWRRVQTPPYPFIRPIDNRVLHYRDVSSYDPGLLYPPGFSPRVQTALQFSRFLVDFNINRSAAQHNWSLVRHADGPPGEFRYSGWCHFFRRRTPPAPAVAVQAPAMRAMNQNDHNVVLFATRMGYDDEPHEVEFALSNVDRTNYAAGIPPPHLRVRVRDSVGINGIDMYMVSRVQFVSDGQSRSYLRLYTNGLGTENILDSFDWLLGPDDPVLFHNGIGDQPPLSSALARARVGVLVFRTEQVWNSRNLWRNVGYYLQSHINPLLLQAEPRPALAIAPPPAAAGAAGGAGAAAAADNAAAADDAADYDISALLAAATLEDQQHLRAWECAICQSGIDEDTAEDRELMMAHAAHEVAAAQPGATAQQCLHVFHKHCLQRWRLAGRACSPFCPTCKLPLDPRPLPAAWRPGSTTLSARMGANPFCTGLSGMRPNVYMVTGADTAVPESQAGSNSLRSLRFRFTGMPLMLESHCTSTYLEHLRDAFQSRFLSVPGAGPHRRGIRVGVQRIMRLAFAVDDRDPENLEHQSTFYGDNPMQILNIRRNCVHRDLFASNPFFDAELRSADRKHTVRVMLPVDRAPGEPVIIIQYTGPLSFRLYSNPKGRCQAVQRQ